MTYQKLDIVFRLAAVVMLKIFLPAGCDAEGG